MNYLEKTYGRCKIHFLQTDQFKTNCIRVNFKRKTEEHEITIHEMLRCVMRSYSKDYPTRKEYLLKCQELYDVLLGSRASLSGQYMILSFFFKFINEEYTEIGMNEESLRFFFNRLTRPNVTDGKFDEEIFELEKRDYLDYLKSRDDNPDVYASRQLRTLMGQGTPLAYETSGTIEDLEKVTPENLYQFYLDVFKNDLIDIFVVGNLDIKWFETLVGEYFPLERGPHERKSHSIAYLPKDQVIEKREVRDFKQSKLRMGYYIPDMTPFEKKYVLGFYNFILGGGPNSLLFANVREKNSLCYNIRSNFSAITQTFTIAAGISAHNYEKTVAIIEEQIENMRQGNFSDQEVETARKNYEVAYTEKEDDQDSIINLYETHEYLDYDLLEERLINNAKVTKEDIVALAQKVQLDVIYFLEGGN